MPRTIVFLPDLERYHIFEILDLPSKVGKGLIELTIRTHFGPPEYIVPFGDLPEGTVSQILRYRLPPPNGWKLVKAHQYLLPDGTIRGPDPLYICIDELVVGRSKDRTDFS